MSGLDPLTGIDSSVLLRSRRILQLSDAPSSIVSCSAEPPVIRGHGRGHAFSCLFVRDQELSCASHFCPCWPVGRHKGGHEVAEATRFIRACACWNRWGALRPSCAPLMAEDV